MAWGQKCASYSGYCKSCSFFINKAKLKSWDPHFLYKNAAKSICKEKRVQVANIYIIFSYIGGVCKPAN